MARKLYRYRAVDQFGEPVNGVMEEESAEQVTTILGERGLQVNDVQPDKPDSFERAKGRPLTWDEVAQFNEHLVSITRAKLPLAPSLKAIAHDLDSGRLRNAVLQVQKQLEGGSSLEDAIERFGDGFPPVYRSMIRAGERTGNLSGVLDMMNRHSNRMLDLKAQLAVVLSYPLIVSSMAMFVVLFLLIKVVPVFEDIFEEFGAGLPEPTQFLVSLSHLILDRQELVLTVVGVTVFALISLYIFLKRSRNGQVILDRFLMHLPFIGPMFRLSSLSRFAQSLGLMLQSQVPILESLDLAATSSGNALLKRHVDEAAIHIAQGEKVADALSDTGYFPHGFCWFLANGENYGELPQTLLDVSESYEQSIATQDRVTLNLLGPIIVFGLAFVIGFIVIALYLPIFTLGDAMGG